MQINPNAPIGIFDSGIGGLTVAHTVKSLLPNEEIIYFGDTTHLPYGEKSTAALQSYTIKSIDFLLKHGAKIIIIACNSASAAAYELACAYVGTHTHIVNVIEPVVNYVAAHFSEKTVGLIGTRQTVNSGVYEKKMKEKEPSIILKSLATPLLASAIEEGFFDNKISSTLIEQYLSNPTLQNVEALILGCTHYPLIKAQINTFYGNNIQLIDGSWIVAESVFSFLENNNLLRNLKDAPNDKFYVSDLTESFAATTEIFFQKRVNLELHKFWE